jgi:DNA-binding SARP family transcriptional activator
MAASLLKQTAPAPGDPPSRTAQHQLALGQVALARGDTASAIKQFEHAAQQYEAADNKRQLAVACVLRARAMYDAHQPRKSMAELERAAHIADELGYRQFLRPYAAGATEMLEYAQVRHVAPGLIAVLAADGSTAAARAAGSAAAVNADMLPAVRAFAFGRGSVLVGERQVSDLEWRSEKSKEMFFYLLQRNEGATKEEIFAALWPDLPESKCNSNFHSSLYRLRRALFHECVVRDSGGAYALNPKGVFISDVDAFNRAMLAADVARDEAERTQKLEEAVGAYKGGFLSSTYSDWTETIRRELEDRYVEALNELGAQRLREGRFEEALPLFRALEDVDSYSESAVAGIMRAHIGMNDGQSAVRQYRRFRELLQKDLDEEPSERLESLYREATGKS